MKQIILFSIVVLFVNSVFITFSIALDKNSNAGLDSLYVVPNSYTSIQGTALHLPDHWLVLKELINY